MLLSVIIPVYNVDKYVEECIRSVIMQNIENCEIIVVNDGSTDSSSDILNILSQEYSSLRIINQENRGLPEARNTGIENSIGEYICFVDSDDMLKTGMFQHLINEIIKENADLAICNINQFDKKKVYQGIRYFDKVLNYTDENSEEFFALSLDSCCNKVFKRSIIEKYKIRFESKNVLPQEDFYFVFKYLCYIQRIVIISKCYYFYRIRRSSITRKPLSYEFAEKCSHFPEIIQYYSQYHHINRNISDFELHLIYNMLFASINGINAQKPGDIKKIILIYRTNCSKFICAMKHQLKIEQYKLQTIKKVYDRIILHLLIFKLDYIVSILEYLRIKRLRRIILSLNIWE